MQISHRMILCATALLLAAAAPVHDFLSVAVSPDGGFVASIEGDESAAGTADIRHVVIRRARDAKAVTIILPCGAVRECMPSSLAWSPDGHRLSFVLRSPGTHDHAIYSVNADGSNLVRELAFNGTLVSLSYGPGGQIAVLATQGAEKEVGATEAGAAQTGELGGDIHEQRVAVLGKDGTLHFASPPDLFVYEYAWRPDGSGFVGTAAPGDGDNNWWIAKLYAFDALSASAKLIYTASSPQQQLAQPAVSPDGKSVSFIGGLMSDFGATGGEAFLLPIDRPGAKAVDLTPNWPATVMSLGWSCDGKHLRASVLHADQTQLVEINPAPQSAIPKPVFSAAEELRGGDTAISTACGGDLTATIHQSFSVAPEIEAGPIGRWHDLTHVNADLKLPVRVQSLSWHDGGLAVQGWLLLPDNTKAGQKMPMITQVHGGPAWANQPAFLGDGFDRKLLNAGYAVFLPNPRGSYGQGEAFTRANVKDFGYGDLRDILTGITEAERVAPIDDHRLGLTGWSYGGYMTMFAVTQTQRFKAAVAGAGIANWQSYYGENGIDEWMIPYFGASVYADPAVYAKSSPMTFIRHVRTPTLEVVGANDVECPAPQTMEFWHALHDLGVPTQSVIYANEGHGMRDPKDLADYQARTLAWFAKYLK
jgi:dipeptidyl aminopeptidase/acylaminoacyl peptidase